MTTKISGTTGIDRVEPTAYGLPLSHRNKIINGKMEIAQRGTSFSGLPNGGYTVDRWSSYYSTSAAVTYTQQADAPSNNEFQNSLRITVSTADTSIAASDYLEVQQIVEGYNARDLIGKTFTLSFWVRSSKTGTHCVSFSNFGTDRSYVSEYTVSAANTWEQKSITVSGGLITAGVWDWTNGSGLAVRWALACGSTFQTTADAWQTGNFIATANQVNCLDTVGNIFAITGVQLEVGSVATPFEHRLYGTELALCQRYYQVIGSLVLRSAAVSGQSTAITVPTLVTLRSSPTVTATNGAGAGHSYTAGSSFIRLGAFPDASGNIGATDIGIASEL